MTTMPATCRNSTDPLVMVDDSHVDIHIARRAFRLAGLSNPFDSFNLGDDFLDYLAEVKKGGKPLPAIVLLDINMPRKNGFEVLEEVRAQDEFEDLPIVVMLTNSNNPADIARADEIGADGYQTKPGSIKDYVDFFKALSAE